MTNKEIEDYKLFMNDIKNAYCCGFCPENKEEELGSSSKLPCGQYNCWVNCHCNGKVNQENRTMSVMGFN